MSQAPIPYEELELAHDWVSSAPRGENRALVSLDTGKIYWISPAGNLQKDDDLPDDSETSDRYLPVPHKNDLNLGTRLVHRFIGDAAPALQDAVYRIFRRHGAYSRYKDLLEQHGLIEVWYRYEADATRLELREWARENGLILDEGPLLADA
jgi:hypothetical protein